MASLSSLTHLACWKHLWWSSHFLSSTTCLAKPPLLWTIAGGKAIFRAHSSTVPLYLSLNPSMPAAAPVLGKFFQLLVVPGKVFLLHLVCGGGILAHQSRAEAREDETLALLFSRSHILALDSTPIALPSLMSFIHVPSYTPETTVSSSWVCLFFHNFCWLPGLEIPKFYL